MTDAEQGPLRLRLELARARDGGDPYAFRFRAQEYNLRDRRGVVRTAELGWGKQLQQDLADVRLPGHDPVIRQRLGETLREFLSPGGWPALDAEIRQAVDAGREVFITFASGAAELYALPWELLSSGDSGRFLSARERVLLRYEWPGSATTPEAADPPGEAGRILVAWSAAAGSVPAAEHVAAIEAAARAGGRAFDPDRDVLPHVTAAGLAAALAAPGPPVRALHLLAHGAAAGSVFGLALNGDGGAAAVVDPAQLRELLAPHSGHVRLVVLAACDGSNAGEVGNHLGGVAQTLHRGGVRTVVGSRAPLRVDASTEFTRVFYRALLGGPTSVERAFRAARHALLKRDGTDWAQVQLYAREVDGDDARPIVFRPYRGLLPFGPEHSRFFFGRDAERRETLADLDALVAAGAHRFLVVAGASGTGKSSMVLSGAVPDLVRPPLVVAAPDDDPARDVRALARRAEAVRARFDSPSLRHAVRLLQDAADGMGASAAGWRSSILRPGADPHGALDAALATHASREPGSRLLVVVDQFEEVFTLGSPDARDTFGRRLWELSRADDGVHVIITIRVDFLGRCGEVTLDDRGLRLDAVAYDEAHRVFVAQMAPGQLRASIVEPARKVGLRLDDGLAERMLADVGAEPGALPLLQYTLDLLWQRRSGAVLTAAAYDELGGVVGALRGRADALVDALDGPESIQARRLLVRLVGAGDVGAMDTRRRVRIAGIRPSEPADAERFDAVLARFVDARLLVRSGDEAEATVEVAHEALIRSWERLQEWVQEDRGTLAQLEEVEDAVEAWRKHGALLEDSLLGYALRVRDQHPGELSADAEELIELSVRRARRRRIYLISATVFVILSLVATTVVLVVSKTRGDAARARAEDASASSIAASLTDDPSRRAAFLLLVSEDTLTDPVDERGLTRSWRDQAIQVLHRTLRSGYAKSDVRNPTLALSPDGARLLVVGTLGSPTLYDLTEGPFPEARAVDPVARATRLPVFHSDGRYAFAGRRRVFVDDAWVDLPRSVAGLAFEADGSLLVQHPDASATRVTRDGVASAAESVPAAPDPAAAGLEPHLLRSVVPSPQGAHHWAGTTWEGDLVIVADGVTQHRSHAPHAVAGVAWSGDGDVIVSWDAEGSARLWTQAGRLLERLDADESWAHGALDGDGSTVALVDQEGNVSVFRPRRAADRLPAPGSRRLALGDSGRVFAEPPGDVGPGWIPVWHSGTPGAPVRWARARSLRPRQSELVLLPPSMSAGLADEESAEPDSDPAAPPDAMRCHPSVLRLRVAMGPPLVRPMVGRTPDGRYTCPHPDDPGQVCVGAPGREPECRRVLSPDAVAKLPSTGPVTYVGSPSDADGDVLVAGYWDPEAEAPVLRVLGPGTRDHVLPLVSPAIDVLLSPGSRFAVAGLAEGQLVFVDLQGDDPVVHPASTRSGAVRPLDISHDGTLLVSAKAGRLLLHDVATRRLVTQLPIRSEDDTDAWAEARFSADGRTLQATDSRSRAFTIELGEPLELRARLVERSSECIDAQWLEGRGTPTAAQFEPYDECMTRRRGALVSTPGTP